MRRVGMPACSARSRKDVEWAAAGATGLLASGIGQGVTGGLVAGMAHEDLAQRQQHLDVIQIGDQPVLRHGNHHVFRAEQEAVQFGPAYPNFIPGPS